MARQVLTYTVPEGKSRDAGKTFVITEMSAFEIESWAMRALLVIMANNVVLPPDLSARVQSGEAGLADIATLGLKSLSGLRYADAKPLLDDMMTCVKIAPDKRNPSILREIVDEDIEEIMTIVELRKLIWGMHTNFLPAADAHNTAT